jgi:hypothetical protein
MAVNVRKSGEYRFELRAQVDPKFRHDPGDLMLSHHASYIAMTNERGKSGRSARWSHILHIYRGDTCVLALPIRSQGPLGVTTGYSGFLLPAQARESGIRAAFLGLRAFLRQNRSKRFDLQHAVWRKSVANAEREAVVWRIATEYFAPDLMPSRVLDLAQVTVTGQGSLLALYDQKVRNQIRHAKTDGMAIVTRTLQGEAALAALHEGLAEAYTAWQPPARRPACRRAACTGWKRNSRPICDRAGRLC